MTHAEKVQATAKQVEKWIEQHAGPLTSTQITTLARREGYDPFIARRALRRPWFKLVDGGWALCAGVVILKQAELPFGKEPDDETTD